MSDLTKIPCGIVKLNIPMDIICNGFSMKETIKEVFMKYKDDFPMNDAFIDMMAEEIKEAFAVKLRVKQG